MDIGSIGIGIGLAKYFTECHCVDLKLNRISRINWRTDGNLARSVHRIGVNNRYGQSNRCIRKGSCNGSTSRDRRCKGGRGSSGNGRSICRGIGSSRCPCVSRSVGRSWCRRLAIHRVTGNRERSSGNRLSSVVPAKACQGSNGYRIGSLR